MGSDLVKVRLDVKPTLAAFTALLAPASAAPKTHTHGLSYRLMGRGPTPIM